MSIQITDYSTVHAPLSRGEPGAYSPASHVFSGRCLCTRVPTHPCRRRNRPPAAADAPPPDPRKPPGRTHPVRPKIASGVLVHFRAGRMVQHRWAAPPRDHHSNHSRGRLPPPRLYERAPAPIPKQKRAAPRPSRVRRARPTHHATSQPPPFVRAEPPRHAGPARPP